MSVVFWDNYLDLSDLYKKVKLRYVNDEERQEASTMIDEIIHHRLMGCILTNLESHHHTTFLELFTANPTDSQIEDFLKTRIRTDIFTLIKMEIEKIKREILDILHL